jgi:4-amino-4-deoxy-L-arabinose transferase-like glycosyltransferase
MSRVTAVPRPLAALLAVTVLLGVAWALLLPPFQAPDEDAHFAYVQTIAERGALPGAAGRDRFSTEQRLAGSVSNSQQTAQQILVKPTWAEAAADRWDRIAGELPDSARSDGGGPNAASSNPPLYYVWSVLPYELASGGDIFARLTAIRLASILFLCVTVAATWLLAGQVFGPRRDLQLAAAALPALAPMVTFISASASPDPLMFALWTVALWLGVRILKGRQGPLDVAAFLAAAGGALATKATSYALLPGVLLVLGVLLWRVRHRRRLVSALVAASVLGLAATAGAWFVVASGSDRPAAKQLTDAAGVPDSFDGLEFGSYLWQFYLPRLPFQTDYPGMESFRPRAYDVWLRESVGKFGWLEVTWPPNVYRVTALIVLAVLALALVALRRRWPTADKAVLAFLGLTGLSLLAGLHWNEYKLGEEQGVLINQGRYLFPIVGLAGLACAAALTALPQRRRGLALGAFVAALAVLELFSLGNVAGRFYA